MHSHFLYLCLFSLAVGAVLGAMLRSDRKEAIRLALWIALGLASTAVALAWVMYAISH